MKNSIIKSLPVLSLLIVFIINLIAIISMHFSWDNSMQKYLPLQNEIKVLKSDLSQAHLWLEEALGGDSTIDIQKEVMTPFAHKPFSLYIQNSENTLNELKDQEYMQ
ncbi:MAG: hypothetical protein KAI22_03370, partial [Gammaproteobacteria bacterium]|nr:hypothetical protein [Gammaproteobacteria bacterium]